jgi:hypothetical protein
LRELLLETPRVAAFVIFLHTEPLAGVQERAPAR